MFEEKSVYEICKKYDDISISHKLHFIISLWIKIPLFINSVMMKLFSFHYESNKMK